MTTDKHRLYIGTKGWDHPNWQHSFYPDDIPSEWALTYYSNEIPVVFVPQEMAWQNQTAAMLEASNEQFRFLLGLEVTGEGVTAEYLQAIAALAERLLGLVLRVDSRKLTVSQLQSVLDQLQGYRVVVDLGSELPISEEWQACLDRNQINPCYYAENTIPETSTGNLNVCLMAQEYDPKGLRNIIEPCLKLERPDLELALILTSSTPSLEVLRNVEVIAGLL